LLQNNGILQAGARKNYGEMSCRQVTLWARRCY
jgi:hypothetical protein